MTVAPESRSTRLLVTFLAALGLFGIDTTVAVARGWSPLASRLQLGVVAGAACLAAALLLGMVSSSGRAWIERRWRELTLTSAAVVLTALAAESTLAMLGDRIEAAPFHCHPRGLRYVTHPELPGVSPVARFSVNSLGLRGPEPTKDSVALRVITVGGSTTECLYLDDEKTWTHLLALRLDTIDSRRSHWVGSAGKSGFATVEHLQFLRRSSVVDRADVVVVLAGINDLARALWGEDADAIAGKAAPFWTGSRILALARRSYARVDPRNLVMDRDALFIRNAQTRRHEAQVMQGAIDLSGAVAAYGQRLTTLVEASRARGIGIVLATQPSLFRADLTPEEEQRLWFLQRADGTYLPPKRMRELMDSYNAMTRQVAGRTETALAELTSMDGNPAYFYDDCHFDEAGAAEVARLIAGGVDWSRFQRR